MQGSVTDKKKLCKEEVKKRRRIELQTVPALLSLKCDRYVKFMWVENRGKRTKNASVLQHFLSGGYVTRTHRIQAKRYLFEACSRHSECDQV